MARAWPFSKGVGDDARGSNTPFGLLALRREKLPNSGE